VQHRKLSGDIFNACGEPDYCIAGFVVAAGEAHRAKGRHADRCPRYRSNDFDHNPLRL
jgi:hypothetical protein